MISPEKKPKSPNESLFTENRGENKNYVQDKIVLILFKSPQMFLKFD